MGNIILMNKKKITYKEVSSSKLFNPFNESEVTLDNIQPPNSL